jgi:hypothetical protein
LARISHGPAALPDFGPVYVGLGSWLRENAEIEFANGNFVSTSINLKNKSAGEGCRDKTIEKTILRAFLARPFLRSQGQRATSVGDPCDLFASSRRRQFVLRPDIRRTRQSRRSDRSVGFVRLHGQVLYEVVADIRSHDRIRVSCFLADAHDLRCGAPVPNRLCGPKELPMVEKSDSQVARNLSLPRLVASRKNQARAYFSAGLGRAICLASEQ